MKKIPFKAFLVLPTNIEDLRRVMGPCGDSIPTKSNASPPTNESSFANFLGAGASHFLGLPRPFGTPTFSDLVFTKRPGRFVSMGAAKTAEVRRDVLEVVVIAGGFEEVFADIDFLLVAMI